MKKLLFLPFLVLLTSCVTYYHPETALEDGVYYAEDDPSYVVYQGTNFGAAYYPWASLDYFYMGYQPYPVYPYYYGFPLGFGYGYSPWHYPFGGYGYYSPLYASYHHYPFYPLWRPYSGYCAHDRVCGGKHDNHRDRDQKRFAGGPKTPPRKGEDDETGDEEFPFENRKGLKPAGGGSRPSYNSYQLFMPAGYNGNRGLVVRSNETTKIGKSLIQPVQSGANSNNIIVTAAPPVTGTSAPGNVGNGPSANVSGSRASYRQPSRNTVTSAPSRSSGVGRQSHSTHSAPAMRSRKSGSPRQRNKRD